jgi:hypothetical protein
MAIVESWEDSERKWREPDTCIEIYPESKLDRKSYSFFKLFNGRLQTTQPVHITL